MRLVFLILVLFSFNIYGAKSPFFKSLNASICHQHFSSADIIRKYPLIYQQQNLEFQKKLWTYFKNDKEKAVSLERELASLLKNSSISKRIDIPMGLSKPKLVLLDLDVMAVMKKATGNSFTNANSEIAAYKIDRLLNMNIVPLTIKRKVQDQDYSLQLFVRDAYTGEEIESKVVKKSLSNKGKEQFKKMRIFDYLIGNQDRGDDYLAINKNKIVAIDNGDAFQDREHQDYILSKNNLSFFLTQEGADFLGKLTAIENNVYYEALDGLVSDEIIDLFIERKEFLVYRAEKYIKKYQ